MKLSLEKLKANKREIYFAAVGFVLAALLLYLFIEAVDFLVVDVENALEVGGSTYQPVRFNIDALKTLGIISNPATGTSPAVSPPPSQ